MNACVRLEGSDCKGAREKRNVSMSKRDSSLCPVETLVNTERDKVHVIMNDGRHQQHCGTPETTATEIIHQETK